MRSRAAWLALACAVPFSGGCGAGTSPADGDAAVDDASGGAGGFGDDAAGASDGGGLSVIALADAGGVAEGKGAVEDAGMRDAGRDEAALPYARGVVDFSPGAHAGHGQDGYPDVVLGPPDGLGTAAGSLDVLSLGVGGEIVLHFGALAIVDGEGPDFVVFENPFWPGGDPAAVFAEPGEVAVSEDGETWHVFTCDPLGAVGGRYPGCAGWTPTLGYDPQEVLPLDPVLTGGDAFDLAAVGLARARYVRVRDLAGASEVGEDVTAGFDLDGVGLVHHAPLP